MTYRRYSQTRFIGAMVLGAFLVGPVTNILVQQGEVPGGLDPAIFGLLLVVLGFLIREMGAQSEALILGTDRKPWLSGRLRRYQRLILPTGTATILPLGFSASFAGARYLLTAPPGWNAANTIAFGFIVVGILLQALAMTRLCAAVFLIKSSGLWGPSRRAWLIAAAGIALGTILYVAHGVENAVGIVPAI